MTKLEMILVRLNAQLDDGHDFFPAGAEIELPRARALRLESLGMATVLNRPTEVPKSPGRRKSRKADSEPKAIAPESNTPETDDDTKPATPEDAGDDNPDDDADFALDAVDGLPDPDSIPPDDDEE